MCHHCVRRVCSLAANLQNEEEDFVGAVAGELSSLLCGLDQALCCTQAQAARHGVLDCWGPTWGLLLVVSVSDYCAPACWW